MQQERRNSNKSAFFADQDVGIEALRHVLAMHPADVKCVVTVVENEISKLARDFGCTVWTYDQITTQNVGMILSDVDVLFLAWWPKIIPAFIISAPRVGTINFHPSLLPFNRGKNYNFWNLVEDAPFGVTLHFVDGGIDSGDIIFQVGIPKDWTDTGGSLYGKAKHAMVALFKSAYCEIMNESLHRKPQRLDLGTFHYAGELEPASQIDLDKQYSGRELLNLLRARTFIGKPSCYFFSDGKKFEVRVSITEVDNGSA
jgi:methionyl-tRNA formyltransferase